MNCVLSRFLLTTRFSGPVDSLRGFSLSRELVEESVRRVCCGDKEYVGGCSGSCAWHRGFRQEISADPEVVRRHQKPGNPFIFDFPHVDPVGGAMSIGLTLFGSAVQDSDVYINAISRLSGRWGGSPRVTVDSLDLQGERHPVGDSSTLQGDRLTLISLQDVFDSAPSARKVILHFETPLRLFHGGRQLSKFDFPLFFRSLLRRVSSLVGYYCEDELDIDFAAVSRAAGEVTCISREIRTVALRKDIGGFAGSAVIEGDLEDLLPILKAGELLHAGKGASFGYGRFRVEFPDQASLGRPPFS